MQAKSTRFIAYYRVSTDRQGRSGLGLEAQRAAVVRYLAGIGGILIAEHTEVETGRRNDRPELQSGIDHAAELNETSVAGALDEASVMHSDGGIDQIAAERAQPRKRPLLVGAGKFAVSGDIRRQNRR